MTSVISFPRRRREVVEIQHSRTLPQPLRGLVEPRPLVVVHRFPDGGMGPIWSGHDHRQAMEAARSWAASRLQIIDATSAPDRNTGAI